MRYIVAILFVLFSHGAAADYEVKFGNRTIFGVPLPEHPIWANKSMFLTCEGQVVELPKAAQPVYRNQNCCNLKKDITHDTVKPRPIVLPKPPCKRPKNGPRPHHIIISEYKGAFSTIEDTYRNMIIRSAKHSQTRLNWKSLNVHEEQYFVRSLNSNLYTPVAPGINRYLHMYGAYESAQVTDCPPPKKKKIYYCPNCLSTLNQFIQRNKDWRARWWKSGEDEQFQEYYKKLEGRLICKEKKLQLQLVMIYF